ncbi:hypothetical protein BDV93DRAFT_546426 [Ceratobasidium sp. AG-I]|nr:hypothetical protein BDV93DRAFT_546426 [Ceratobasidium sp. AG-I]
MRHAVFLIVDPLSSDGQDTIDGYGDRPDKRVLRPEWVHMCVAAGRIVVSSDWAGCRLGRGPPPRKRPADDPADPSNAHKHPRTDHVPAPVSYAYNPAYPLMPGYYPPAPSPAVAPQPAYAYYDPGPASTQQQIKKRTPRPPRQPNRPWSLEENIALYTFMVQNPAPTEREQATLVRRWAKETRPDRGRQSWVAHAFATSFKNWVKEYEAGNINANPADFAAGADADAEADPDPDHDEHEHEHAATPEYPTSSATNSDFTQSAAGTEYTQPSTQFGPNRSYDSTQPAQFGPQPQAGPSYTSASNSYTPTGYASAQNSSTAAYPTTAPNQGQYTSPTPTQSQQQYTPPTPAPQQYTSPTPAQTQQYTSPTSTQTQQYTSPTSTPVTGQYTSPSQAPYPSAVGVAANGVVVGGGGGGPAPGSPFPQFNVPREAQFGSTDTNAGGETVVEGGADKSSAGENKNEQPNVPNPGVEGAGNGAGAGFPAMYPLVYPPADGAGGKETA